MGYTVPARVEKLSLTARKSMRDGFEAKKVELQERVTKCTGLDSFSFELDINQLYAYATSSSRASENPGPEIFAYFDKFVTSLEEYTSKGSDAEAKEACQKVLSKKQAVLAASVEADGINYCAVRIRDGQALLLFKPDQFGSWQSEIGRDLGGQVDKALNSMSGGGLSISAKRSIATELEPRVKAAQAKLEKIFGQPIPIGYNVEETLKFLRIPENRKACSHISEDKFEASVPSSIGQYFEKATETLASSGFETDDMMKEAFLENAGEKGMIFEVVKELKHGSYNDCIFEDGYFKLQTVPGQFGSWIGDIARPVVDRL